MKTDRTCPGPGPCILFWEDEKDMVLENPAAQARAVAG